MVAATFLVLVVIYLWKLKNVAYFFLCDKPEKKYVNSPTNSTGMMGD